METPPFTTTVEPSGIVVVARGASGSELFAAACAAYFSSVCDLAKVRPVQAYELERQAESLEELFLGWMNDLVWGVRRAGGGVRPRQLLLLLADELCGNAARRAARARGGMLHGTSCSQPALKGSSSTRAPEAGGAALFFSPDG